MKPTHRVGHPGLEGKTLRASVFLAAAAAIKLVPLMLLLFVLLRRDIKLLAASIILFAVFCLAPVVSLGGDLFGIYGEYIRNFVFGKFAGTAGDQTYFTLSGFVGQVIPVLKTWWGLKYLSALLVAAALCAVDIIAVRRNGRAAGVWTFHLYLLGILLITPLSETHHLALLMPLFLLMVVGLLYERDLPIKPISVALGLFLACFYLGRMFGGPLYFVAILALLVAVGLLSVGKRRPVQGWEEL